jgi:prophage regulatory protein
MSTVILRLPAVRLRTGLSRSTIYLRIAQGTFPAPVSLGARAVGWIESEVDEWLALRIAQSREPGGICHPQAARFRMPK